MCPRTAPCGTPFVISRRTEEAEPTVCTHWLQQLVLKSQSDAEFRSNVSDKLINKLRADINAFMHRVKTSPNSSIIKMIIS